MTEREFESEEQGTTDVLKILHRRFFEGRPEMERSLEEETVKMTVGQEVYRLRTDRGLTRTELAQAIGTTPEEIEDLEEADYEGDSLVLLRRIASAIGKEVRILVIDKEVAPTVDEKDR